MHHILTIRHRHQIWHLSPNLVTPSRAILSIKKGVISYVTPQEEIPAFKDYGYIKIFYSLP